MFIDTHAHLYVSEFNHDRKEVMDRAQFAGVTNIVMPAIDSETTEAMHALKLEYPTKLHLMMGLHPTHVGKNFKNELTHVREQLETHSFVAVGEIGIDLYWDKSNIKEQKQAFITQIEWALEFNLPIIIHCREAFDEIFGVLEKINDSNLCGILHCFTGNLEEAHRAISLNMLLGIGGVVTFKNSGLAEIVSKLPIEHIVLETDSPYLAPMPYRGKRNESSFLTHIANKVALLHKLDVNEVAIKTSENAKKLFGI
jgi:TatD DNase family protein